MAAELQPRRSYWPLWVLLGVNALSLPATFSAIYFSQTYPSYANRNLFTIATAVLYGQLFLLAFWMSFGTWPGRWRRLMVTVVACTGGALLGLGIAIDLAARSNLDFFLILIIQLPIFVSALLWITNTLFMIPAAYFGYEIGVHRSTSVSKASHHAFSIAQMLIWTAQCAVLFAVFKAVSVLQQSSGVFRSMAPFMLVVTCCTPLAVALLKAKPAFLHILAAILWASAIGALTLFIPWGFGFFFVPWTVAVHCGVVAANLITLRCLGFCWQPRVEPVGQADG